MSHCVGAGNWIQGPVEEQQVLLTSELSLHTEYCDFKTSFAYLKGICLEKQKLTFIPSTELLEGERALGTKQASSL